DTVKAQVMVKINSILKPLTIAYNDYNIMFTIPCYSPHPMPLHSEEKYTYLVEHALKAKSPSVKIIIEAKGSKKEKENTIEIDESGESDSETEGKKRKRGKHLKVCQILPGNKAMNDQIGLLRERWRCPSPGGKCSSKYCFVQPDSADHFVLGFRELESWAVAILKGPQFATIDMPPNNNLFNALDPWTVAARSRAWHGANAKVFGFEQGNILIVLLHPPFYDQYVWIMHLLSSLSFPLSQHSESHLSPPMLLPHSLKPGMKMTIENFCTHFSLSTEILECLQKNGYSGTHVIHHIKIEELRSMDFKPGEIAKLKEAVCAWATAN
ncbi:hypothetical protein L208DRAFT_1313391, partial [Tricholoma matsutake]